MLIGLFFLQIEPFFEAEKKGSEQNQILVELLKVQKMVPKSRTRVVYITAESSTVWKISSRVYTNREKAAF
jgi:hypothetical protein